MIIRKASTSDVTDLMELYLNHLTIYPPSEEQKINDWVDMINKISANPNYHLLVSETDGKVVSSVTVVIIQNLTHNLQPYAVIENVVTHACYRGKGYAHALMNTACETAEKSGCYKVMLMTGSKKESTLRFYERCGFVSDKTAFQKRFI